MYDLFLCEPGISEHYSFLLYTENIMDKCPLFLGIKYVNDGIIYTNI